MKELINNSNIVITTIALFKLTEKMNEFVKQICFEMDRPMAIKKGI
ncbi:hypothetical protein AAGV28_05825 [Flavobacterium sp. FZUC8N2.13]|uniref:Uncharacterized protein n=1 Tax=Flavobacterium zubiriense TaxID=3138075 RepID=A0ABV4T9V4_9FLAO